MLGEPLNAEKLVELEALKNDIHYFVENNMYYSAKVKCDHAIELINDIYSLEA